MDAHMNTIPVSDIHLIEDEAIRNELTELVAKIASGELCLESPSPGANEPWTPEEEARLDAALAKIFNFRKPVEGEQ